jgi:hypothetical protein
MKLKVYRTSEGCSSDEVVLVLQKMLDQLYIPDERGNYAAGTIEEAKQILYSTQSSVYGFLRNVVSQLEEDDALAMLAEIDHRLTFHDEDFRFDYDINQCGHSESPYTLFLQYGDPNLGFAKLRVNDMI